MRGVKKQHFALLPTVPLLILLVAVNKILCRNGVIGCGGAKQVGHHIAGAGRQFRSCPTRTPIFVFEKFGK